MTSSRVASLLMVAVAAAGVWAAEDAPRLDFALDDQFGTTHTDEECGGAVVVLLGGDRKGSTYIAEWGPVLQQTYDREFAEGAVCSVGFAHLKGAPFFVKKKIVASFSKDPEAWILLDWKGVISKNWGAEKDAANLYVFDRRGELVYSVSLREFDQAVVESIIGVVEKAVAEQ
jgi:hypothetical protein